MVEYTIADNKLTTFEPNFPSHTFELVDQAPLGYVIWNIGDHMPEGYLPFARPCMRQPFEGGRNIDPDTLKAVPCEGAQAILAASIHCGAENLREMEAFVKKHQNAKPGSRYYDGVQKALLALPYMRAIHW